MSLTPNERTHVELPFIEQLARMGWRHIEGDTEAPHVTERGSFREVLLTGRLRAALRRINQHDGREWLDDRRINEAVGALERLGAHKLMEANGVATDLLLSGTTVDGDPLLHGGREQTVRYIDVAHPERNDFLAINQFRVDRPGGPGQGYIIPDIVLFVNGIPLVVVECKSPAATDPMEEAITQLLRYSNAREWVDTDEGVERLFHYNAFMVATSWYEARAGTVGASYEHYLEWKDTAPVPRAEVAAELGVDTLTGQQVLVAGMLRPAHLLDIVRNFTQFGQAGGATIKIVARYQQYRAVQKAIARLQGGQTKVQHGESDGRGGIIWHTQGSGKSLTMVFLVRKMRTLPALRRFKVVVVTDRTDLQKQLGETARLTGETVRTVRSTAALQDVLREEGPDLVFAMIQKYQERDDDAPDMLPTVADRPLARVAEAAVPYDVGAGEAEEDLFPTLNESEAILVLVDEAHRSQSSTLHGNLMRALPNCARIGFTGTPIMTGERKATEQIFGTFIDRYTIQQAEDDGATVPILYEGRTVQGAVDDGRSVDELFEDMFRERTPAERERLKRKYATAGNVLEAPKLVEAKARDMLRHYVETVLPNGFKAQVVASSRRAAILYQQALEKMLGELVAGIEVLDPALRDLDDEALGSRDRETQYLVRASRYLDTIRRLEVAAVISGAHNDPADWREWSDPAKREAHIERFKKPLVHDDKADGLAFLCVNSMLLTGFDAPVEQVLYLDRFLQGHGLLQAIARVNRTAPGKTCGLVVDYFGVGRHLTEALAVYSTSDTRGALTPLKDELPKLDDRHRRVLALFHEHGIAAVTPATVDDCVELLRDVRLRAAFITRLHEFLESLDTVLPRPEALPYVRDAKLLGFINKAAANRYRDEGLNLVGAGRKVRELIDRHIVAQGVDPTLPPISIMDPGFEAAVQALPSDRAKASEMEHAARRHISVHYREDPARYRRLSERLEEVLRNFQDNWAALVEHLVALTREIQARRPANPFGLDDEQAPFYDLLVEDGSAAGELSDDERSELAAQTIELVEKIARTIRVVDFWRNPHALERLRGEVIDFLDERNIVPFERQQPVADRIVELARAQRSRLVAEG